MSFGIHSLGAGNKEGFPLFKSDGLFKTTRNWFSILGWQVQRECQEKRNRERERERERERCGRTTESLGNSADPVEMKIHHSEARRGVRRRGGGGAAELRGRGFALGVYGAIDPQQCAVSAEILYRQRQLGNAAAATPTNRRSFSSNMYISTRQCPKSGAS